MHTERLGVDVYVKPNKRLVNINVYTLLSTTCMYTVLQGITSSTVKLEETVSQEELLKVIQEKNNDDSVDGVLVQLPVPPHIR